MDVLPTHSNIFLPIQSVFHALLSFRHLSNLILKMSGIFIFHYSFLLYWGHYQQAHLLKYREYWRSNSLFCKSSCHCYQVLNLKPKLKTCRSNSAYECSNCTCRVLCTVPSVFTAASVRPAYSHIHTGQACEALQRRALAAAVHLLNASADSHMVHPNLNWICR